jgi:hypothetical protein
MAVPADMLQAANGRSDCNVANRSSISLPFNTPVTWHPYQLNSVMFSQFRKGLMAVPLYFWINPVIVKCLAAV